MNWEQLSHYLPFVSLVTNARGAEKMHSPLITRVAELLIAGAIALAVLQVKLDATKELMQTELANVKSDIAEIKTDIREFRDIKMKGSK